MCIANYNGCKKGSRLILPRLKKTSHKMNNEWRYGIKNIFDRGKKRILDWLKCVHSCARNVSWSCLFSLLPLYYLVSCRCSAHMASIYLEPRTTLMQNISWSRGKSHLELWVTTFLPDWQRPLIFVQFIPNFLYMCSNSMASAHVILK